MEEINKYIAGIDPIAEHNELLDMMIWGEVIYHVDNDGKITHIPFGTVEHDKIMIEFNKKK